MTVSAEQHDDTRRHRQGRRNEVTFSAACGNSCTIHKQSRAERVELDKVVTWALRNDWTWLRARCAPGLRIGRVGVT